MRAASLPLAVALGLAACPAAAGRRVQLTGYADARAIPYARHQGGPVAAFPEPDEHFLDRGFRLDAVGLFAASQLDDDACFLMDLTFRDVGTGVGETRVQYAYLDAALPWGGLRARAGKITIPFNHYSDHRFYPFQRVGLSPPFALSYALGLPMADAGAELSRELELGGWRLEPELYAVNGYGHSPGSTATLRGPLLSQGLGLRRNLRAGNNNKDVALGGRLTLSREGAGQAGASYYRGAWDPDGRRLLQLAGAHLLLERAGLNLLAEYLYIRADGDEGMRASFGSTSWHGHGVLVTVSRPLLTLRGREVVGHARGESYASGRVGGGPGKETLRSAAAGLTSAVSEAVTLKAEYYWVRYALPVTGAASIDAAGRALQTALVVTF